MERVFSLSLGNTYSDVDKRFTKEMEKFFRTQEGVSTTIELLEQAALQNDGGALFELYTIYSEFHLQDEETQNAIMLRYESSKSTAYEDPVTIFMRSLENSLNKLKEDKEKLEKYLATEQGRGDPDAKEWLVALELGISAAEREKPEVNQKLEQTIQQQGIEQFCRFMANDYLHKAVSAGHLEASSTLIGQHEEQAADMVSAGKFSSAISHLDYAEKIYQSVAETQCLDSEKLWIGSNQGKGKTEYLIGWWCISQSNNGDAQFSKKNVFLGIKYLLKAVNVGYVDAAVVGKLLYEQATDSVTNSMTAYYLLEAASDLGHTEASMAVGDWHYSHTMSGESVSDIQFSYESAVKFYGRASSAGLFNASIRLAFIYKAGEVVDKSCGLAIRYLERAVEQSGGGSPRKRAQEMLESAMASRTMVSLFHSMSFRSPKLSPAQKRTVWNLMRSPEKSPGAIQAKITDSTSETDKSSVPKAKRKLDFDIIP